jgi:predicted N-formylglutamate amidohydrolase
MKRSGDSDDILRDILQVMDLPGDTDLERAVREARIKRILGRLIPI